MRATLFADFAKDATVTDVHVATALGNERDRKRKKGKLFDAFIGGPDQPATMTKMYHSVDQLPPAVKDHMRGDETKQRQWMHVFNGEWDQHHDENRSFAAAWAAVNKKDLEHGLKPMGDGVSHSPFPHDPHGLSKLRQDQVPRFLGALTNQESLPMRHVRMSSLTAIQDRVENEKVAKLRGKTTKPALVVHYDGRHYIADGHHRLAAQYLDGHGEADVRYLDLSPLSHAVGKAFNVPIDIKKFDEDKRLVFGWASIVEKDGKIVIDKQDDMIPVYELENAVYDFMLNSRRGHDMHDKRHWNSVAPPSRAIESMVFTTEKQQALGVNLGMQGWWAGWYVDDDGLWKAYKSGERPEFSIGGQAERVEI